jgi:hypothetical protein
MAAVTQPGTAGAPPPRCVPAVTTGCQMAGATVSGPIRRSVTRLMANAITLRDERLDMLKAPDPPL